MGVLWQVQAERRWLAGLVANKKAVAPLLRFLKDIDVGGREGAREREFRMGAEERRVDIILQSAVLFQGLFPSYGIQHATKWR